MNLGRLLAYVFHMFMRWHVAFVVLLYSCNDNNNSSNLLIQQNQQYDTILNATLNGSTDPLEVNVPLQENEYKLKAAFVYQFTEYVNWATSKSPTFNIAVLGNSELTKNLQEIAGRKKVNNKAISIKEYPNLSSIGQCDILFISNNKEASISNALTKFKNTNTLVVTEKEGAKEQGSHINFILEGDKVKFEINLKSAKNSGITISSELLKHATSVTK